MTTRQIIKEMKKDRFKHFVLEDKNKLTFLMDKAEEDPEFVELMKELESKKMTLLFSDKERYLAYKQSVKRNQEDELPVRFVNKTYSDISENALDVLYGDVLWANMKDGWVTVIIVHINRNSFTNERFYYNY